MRQREHRKCHEDLGQLLLGLQRKLWECTADKSTSSEGSAAQQEMAKVAGKAVASGRSLPLCLRDAPGSNLTVPP